MAKPTTFIKNRNGLVVSGEVWASVEDFLPDRIVDLIEGIELTVASQVAGEGSEVVGPGSLFLKLVKKYGQAKLNLTKAAAQKMGLEQYTRRVRSLSESDWARLAKRRKVFDWDLVAAAGW